MAGQAFDFYETIPRLDRFETVGQTGQYVPLPGDWCIGVADIENSTAAIEAGRYKAVNMVGAAVIAAMMNALETRRFPFAFSGDGAAIAVPPEAASVAADALARVQRFSREGLDLNLRVGLVPVSAIRAAGQDVRVALFGASADLSYALFSGNGLKWAEAELKAGRLGVDATPPEAWPDLSGLSCRWAPIRARNGKIVSLIVVPEPTASAGDFARLVTQITTIAEAAPDQGVPVSPQTMRPVFSTSGLAIEVRKARTWPGRVRAYAELFVLSIVAGLSFLTNRGFGGFRPQHYKEVSVQNSDFRKFDDGLLMTLDCDAAAEAALRAALDEARTRGIASYGLHVQDAALMTCLVPSVMTDDHMHFIDGGDGGYARAAAMLKQQAMPAAHPG